MDLQSKERCKSQINQHFLTAFPKKYKVDRVGFSTACQEQKMVFFEARRFSCYNEAWPIAPWLLKLHQQTGKDRTVQAWSGPRRFGNRKIEAETSYVNLNVNSIHAVQNQKRKILFAPLFSKSAQTEPVRKDAQILAGWTDWLINGQPDSSSR